MPTNKASGAGDDKSKATTTQTAKQLANKKIKPAAKKATVKGKDTPDVVKAQIIAALLSGEFQEDQDIATVVGVSKSTVSRLKKQIPDQYLKQIETKKKDRVGDLVIEFLESTLESLAKINVYTSDEEWVKRQDAAGIAVLFGVKSDKIAKILEAIERANEPTIDEIPGTEG